MSVQSKTKSADLIHCGKLMQSALEISVITLAVGLILFKIAFVNKGLLEYALFLTSIISPSNILIFPDINFLFEGISSYHHLYYLKFH